jgi:ZIP family zinc transporter
LAEREYEEMPIWMMAGVWGFVAGLALLLGAAAGYWLKISQRAVATIMAFGSGVLISALSFDLMDDAYQRGGFDATALGFLGGAAVYTAANWYLGLGEPSTANVRATSSPPRQRRAAANSPSPLARCWTAFRSPSSLAMLHGGAVSTVAVIAVFLSNLPEGLSSATGMRKAGRSASYIFGVWGGIAAVSGIATLLEYALFGRFSPDVVAATTAVTD